MKSLMVAVLLFTGIAFAESPQKSWHVGVLQKAAGIGGESTGWQLDKLDVEGKKEDLEKYEGKRVAVFGEMTKKQWVERGEQPLLKAETLLEVSAAENDLKVSGTIEPSSGLTGKHLIRVAAFLRKKAGAVSPGDQQYVAVAANDWKYEMVVPVPADGRGLICEVTAWDDDGDDVADLDKEANSGLGGTSFTARDGSWWHQIGSKDSKQTTATIDLVIKYR